MALLLDLHTHSKHSYDSRLEPAETVRLAKQRGLNGVAVTDHLSVRGGLEARDANDDPRFIVIPGIEYPTEVGHVVGLFVDRTPGLVPSTGAASRGRTSVAVAKGLYPLADVVSAVHGAGGVAVLAHPFEHRKRLADGIFDSGVPDRSHVSSASAATAHRPDALDALEAFNARACASRNPHANRQAEEYACVNRVPVTGGSDAHFPREVGRAGCRIDSLEPGASPEEVKRAIFQGQARAWGEDSPRSIIPLTTLVKLKKARQYAGMPKVLLKLALTAIDPVGLWLENLALRPEDEG